MKMSVEFELRDVRDVRLFVPVQFDAKDQATAKSTADLFREAFEMAAYEVVRMTKPRLAEGQAGDVVRDEISAYQKDRPVAEIEWSLVSSVGRVAEEDRDYIREAARTVQSPLRVVVLDGSPAELLSIVVTLKN